MTEPHHLALIIEDEAAIRRFLRASLPLHGYRILEAVTGAEGLHLAAAQRPDVVILDLGLPDMDGVDLIRQVREWSEVPLIVLSALKDPAGYVPIDVSPEYLRQAAEDIARDFPGVAVTAVCGDYTQPIRLPDSIGAGPGRRVGFFPGSTIGNLTPPEAIDFLSLWSHTLGPGGGMLVGSMLSGVAAKLVRNRLGLMVLGIDSLAGLAMAALAFDRSTWAGAALLAGTGILGGIVQVTIVSWIQHRVPPAMMGRTMSVLMFTFVGLGPLSAAIAGSLLKVVPLPGLFAGAGLTLTAIAVACMGNPALRSIGTPLPVPAAD